MRLHSKASFQRTLVAVCAALLASSICAARHHVQVDLSDASTYASPFQHRCGLLMIGCVVWALGELGLYFRTSIERQFGEA